MSRNSSAEPARVLMGRVRWVPAALLSAYVRVAASHLPWSQGRDRRGGTARLIAGLVLSLLVSIQAMAMGDTVAASGSSAPLPPDEATIREAVQTGIPKSVVLVAPVDYQRLDAAPMPTSLLVEYTGKEGTAELAVLRSGYVNGATIFTLGDAAALYEALSPTEGLQSNPGGRDLIFAVRRGTAGVISETHVSDGRLLVQRSTRIVPASAAESTPPTPAEFDSLTEMIRARARPESTPHEIAALAAAALARWLDLPVNEPPSGRGTPGDAWVYCKFERWVTLDPWHSEFEIDLDHTMYKLIDINGSYDYYLLAENLQTEIVHPHSDGGAYNVKSRHLQLDGDRYDQAGYRQTFLMEHGPECAVATKQTQWTVGGSLSSESGPGLSASYSESWSNECVYTTDLTRNGNVSAEWQDDFPDPDRTPLCIWSQGCAPARSTWFSEFSAIFRVASGSTCPAAPCKVAIGGSFVFYNWQCSLLPFFPFYYYWCDSYTVNWDIDDPVNQVQWGRNLGPKITSHVPEQSPAEVNVGGFLNFNVAAADSDGCAISYQWLLGTQTVGTGASYTYTPACSDPNTRTMTIKATDPPGLLAQYAWTVNVNKTTWIPGTPTIAASGGTTLCGQGTKQLTASATHDPTSWIWNATCGTISGSGAAVTYTAPNVSVPTNCQISVTASNACGTSQAGYVTLTVNPGPGTPTISASGGTTMCGQATNQLTAAATGNPTSWSWSPTCGTISGSGASVTYTAPDPQTQTNCTVTVTAASACGTSSPGSLVLTISPRPGTPNPLSPVCGSQVSSGNVPLTWSAAGGASSYDYELFTNGGCGSPAAMIGSTSGTSFTWSNVPSNVTYSWRVRGKNGNCIGNWSSCCSFTTGSTACPTPGTPTPQSPSCGSQVPAGNVTLSWSGGSNATSYDYELFQNGICSPPASSSGNTSSTTFTWVGVPNCVTYSWHVRARNNNNPLGCQPEAISPWSACCAFQTPAGCSNPPLVPSVPSPVDNATNQSCSLMLSALAQDPDHDVMTARFYVLSDSAFFRTDGDTEWRAGTLGSGTDTDGNGNLRLAADVSVFGTGQTDRILGSGASESLTGDSQFRNVTIGTGAVLNTRGYVLRISGTLTNQGRITDSSSGGSGGPGGAGGRGGDPRENSGGPEYPEPGQPGQPGSPGSFPQAGSGGAGGGGGGGAGGAWTYPAQVDADGGSGGAGSTGGKGGGYVQIWVRNLNNLGLIDADGQPPSLPGGNGTACEYYHWGTGTLLNPFRDLAGGGGGGGVSGAGGNGGMVEVRYGALVSQGTIRANGGAGGTSGAGGSGHCLDHGILSGGHDSGAAGGGQGGAGGAGEHRAGYCSVNGTSGGAGATGEGGAVSVQSVPLQYVSIGEYFSVVFDVGSAAIWEDATVTGTTPSGTAVIATFATDGGNWNASIQALPESRSIQFKLALNTNNQTTTPTVDKVVIRYRPRALIGSATGVADNTRPSVPLSGLDSNHRYRWQCELQDASLTTRGPVWLFRTGNPCPQPGACCNPSNGVCSLLVQTACTSPLTWNGAASCIPNPCPLLSACCTTGGACSLTLQANCVLPGVWHSGWTTCSPNPCPQPGACCNPSNGVCSLLVQTACTSPLTWNGAAICIPNPCPPLGACCDGVSGACTFVPQTACEIPNIWYGGEVCVPGRCQPVSISAAVSSNKDGFIMSIPSPFSSSATIWYEVTHPGTVGVEIVGTSGRVVRRFIEPGRAGGAYRVIWNGRDDGGKDLPTGVYFVRVTTARGTTTGRAILVK